MAKGFDLEEFTCSHCGAAGVKPELVAALEALRERVGAPIHVTSGYRCKQHPTEQNKPRRAVYGYHVQGLAADIACPSLPFGEFLAHVRELGRFTGIGADPERKFVHVDLRPAPARWAYHDGRVIDFRLLAA